MGYEIQGIGTCMLYNEFMNCGGGRYRYESEI